MLAGVIPPVVTPLTTEGEVDTTSLRSLVEHLVNNGVHGLFALGSSGEASFLDDGQRDLVLRTIIESSAEQKVPVLAGCIDTGARRVLDHIHRAADLGAHYAVVTAPFYALTCDADIENHYRWLADRSPLPIVAYDIPVCVHSKLRPEMLVRLGRDGVLVAVKDSSGNQDDMRRLIRLNKEAGRPLRLFTGTEVVVDANLLMGMDGVVPGLGNVAPAAYVRLWELAEAKDWEAAKELQDLLDGLFEIVRAVADMPGPSGAIGAFKRALQHMGVIATSKTSVPLRAFPAMAASRVDELVDDFTRSTGYLSVK